MCRSDRTIRRGFTLLEVVTALLILGTICATILTAMNRTIATAIDLRKRTQAFETARENMENLLSLVNVSDQSDFGTNPLYPDIEWETTVEPFTEPVTNRMWIQAVCTASYTDSAGEVQRVTLTHWLTGLTDKQIQMIQDQQKLENKFLDLLNGNDKTVAEQAAIRRYLQNLGIDAKPYRAILADQTRQKKQWINLSKDDPEVFSELVGTLRDTEYEWLDSISFNWDDFGRWRLENPDPETQSGATGDSKTRSEDSKNKTKDPTGGTPTGTGKGDTSEFDRLWNSGKPTPEGI